MKTKQRNKKQNFHSVNVTGRKSSFCPIRERKRAEMEYQRSLVKYWAGLEGGIGG